jgi:hypothetical protein
MSIARSGRDDSANDLTVAPGPIGVDHGQSEPIGPANGNDSPLRVIPAEIVALQRKTIKDQRREAEVEST